ncbi:DUF2917 domain-containing protein [Aquincola sp. S2]|uniref:DUF2917 domain-containing protein n=1 Tax=Pseudaquabacterium terrae TaxID=2732868 RepID=A0ABX2EEF7_9BURK|nr:DUF2917 domain-containing protein [Aquabacterium terrae]NRF67006.1 DUF2917 domain-containing protein [Aquabacterium terrae]
MHLDAILPRFRFVAPTADRRATPAAPLRHTMRRGAIVTLSNRRQRLQVVRGWLWITRDGQPIDIVLGAGDVFDQEPGPRVLMQAHEEAEVLIAAALPHAHNG